MQVLLTKIKVIIIVKGEEEEKEEENPQKKKKGKWARPVAIFSSYREFWQTTDDRWFDSVFEQIEETTTWFKNVWMNKRLYDYCCTSPFKTISVQ